MEFLSINDVLEATHEEIFEPEDTIIYSVDVPKRDGGVVTHTYSPIGLAFNRILWIVANNVGLPIHDDYVIFNYYRNGFYHGGVTYSILDTIYKDLVLSRPNRDVLEIFNDSVLWAFQSLYNQILMRLGKYYVGADITHLIEIQTHPKIVKAMEVVEKNKDLPSINACYATIKELLHSDEMMHNPVARAYMSGSINNSQLHKMVGPRSFITEINSQMFMEPVTTSFTYGITKSYDWLIESRSPAKALFFSGKAISDSETTGRLMQLVTMILKNIHLEDCGAHNTDEWMDVPVIAPSSSYLGSLPGLNGMTYLDPETGVISKITGDEKHLIGKNIKVRTVFNCKHPDPHGVCVYCYGDIGYNIPRHANVGHYASTDNNSKITQKILGTKHDSNTSQADVKELPDSGNVLINTVKGVRVVNDTVKDGNEYYMYINHRSLRGIFELDPKELDNMDFPNLTAVREFTIKRVDKKGMTREFDYDLRTITRRYGFFSKKFLKFIIKQGPKLDTKNNYIVPLHKWSYADPIILLPAMDYNFTELSAKVDTIFNSNTLNKLNLGFDKKTPRDTTLAYFQLMNTKILSSFSHIAATVLCFTERADDDYRLAKGKNNGKVGTVMSIIANRSISAQTAYESIADRIQNPLNFIPRNKPDHILDGLYRPKDVIDWLEKRVYKGKKYG